MSFVTGLPVDVLPVEDKIFPVKPADTFIPDPDPIPEPVETLDIEKAYQDAVKPAVNPVAFLGLIAVLFFVLK